MNKHDKGLQLPGCFHLWRYNGFPYEKKYRGWYFSGDNDGIITLSEFARSLEAGPSNGEIKLNMTPPTLDRICFTPRTSNWLRENIYYSEKFHFSFESEGVSGFSWEFLDGSSKMVFNGPVARKCFEVAFSNLDIGVYDFDWSVPIKSYYRLSGIKTPIEVNTIIECPITLIPRPISKKGQPRLYPRSKPNFR